MINIVSKLSIKDLSSTYIASVRGDKKNLIEFVYSTPPPYCNHTKKLVIILSSQIGCPLRCRFCDAGKYYRGNLTKDELISQVEYIIDNTGIEPDKTEKFKIQFARMGEPSLNISVIDAMLSLKERYPMYIPCIATTAPLGSEKFFERLLSIKDMFIDFQLQFSINSTDTQRRDYIMPFRKHSFEWISEYSKRFHLKGKRKIVLNFAISEEDIVDYSLIGNVFDPEKNIIKLTPVNPTENAKINGFTTEKSYQRIYSYLERHSKNFIKYGFESIISIGDLRENQVFSNCGQIASQISDSINYI